jgi:hypothetical protein
MKTISSFSSVVANSASAVARRMTLAEDARVIAHIVYIGRNGRCLNSLSEKNRPVVGGSCLCYAIYMTLLTEKRLFFFAWRRFSALAAQSGYRFGCCFGYCFGYCFSYFFGASA